MKILIPVPDIHCPGCLLAIEALEDTLPGVTRIEASYAVGSVTVEFDANWLTPELIRSALQTLGFHPGPAGLVSDS